VLAVQVNGAASAARLEGVLSAVPSTVRTLERRLAGATPVVVLRALQRRPPRAHTVRPGLTAPLGPLGPLVDASGWRVLDFEGSLLGARAAEFAELVRGHPALTFGLGGANLDAAGAAAVDAPNVRWAPPDAGALLVISGTGAAFPLSRRDGSAPWGLPLEPLGGAWLFGDSRTVLAAGDTFTDLLGVTYQFLQGPSLDEACRALLAVWPG
jgi:hypothetical protein